MARNAALLLAIIVFAYAAVCLVLFAAQRSMIYFPQPSTGEGPGNALKILVPGVELRVSVRAHFGPKALIYFGGNAEDVSLSLPAFASFAEVRPVFGGYQGRVGLGVPATSLAAIPRRTSFLILPAAVRGISSTSSKRSGNF